MRRRREMQVQQAFIEEKRKNSLRNFLFVVYALFGVYFLNAYFGFFNLPESFIGIEGFIFLIGGILLILSSLKFLKRK